MSNRRDRKREIAEVLSRHGLGYLVGVVGLDRWVPFHHGLLGHERREAPYTRPEHLRLALEQLGPTFVKLGQILSTRPDLVAPDYQAQLSKLQDAAPPVRADVIRDVVAHEFGSDAGAMFASFDFEPLAAASIGQAHAATLPDGTDVVVKFRRPGAVEQIEQDLEILRDLAARASRHWEAAADYDLVGLADEFARTLRSELDYLREGRSAERVAANFSDDPGVHIPRVFWEATTSRVLTLERIRGIKVNDLDALDAAGIDRRALAERATRVTAQMVFRDGFFHADPHPGNFFIEPDGRIGIIDFGMVGVVDDRLRDHLAMLLVGLTREDPDEVAGALLALGVARGAVDRALLRDDLAGLLARYSGRAVGEIALGPVINDVFEIMRRHHLQVPGEVALLLKVVIMDEGMAAQLDPEFRLGDVLAPYARDLVLREFSPAALARRLGRAGIDTAKLGAELPEQLRRLLGALENGGVEVRLRPEELESILVRAERLGNRLIAGVIAAAFIDGLAELMAVDPQRWRTRQRPLFAIGFGAAGTLAAYVAWSAGRTPEANSSLTPQHASPVHPPRRSAETALGCRPRTPTSATPAGHRLALGASGGDSPRGQQALYARSGRRRGSAPCPISLSAVITSRESGPARAVNRGAMRVAGGESCPGMGILGRIVEAEARCCDPSIAAPLLLPQRESPRIWT